jgi:hypothetical protein
MAIQLPPAIQLYVEAENSCSPELLAQCFAPDAVVHDEGRVHKGLAAIKGWKAETKQKYNHIVEPLEIFTRDGKTILRARLSGNFPGSPVVLSFTFGLKGGKIATLTIG